MSVNAIINSGRLYIDIGSPAQRQTPQRRSWIAQRSINKGYGLTDNFNFIQDIQISKAHCISINMSFRTLTRKELRYWTNKFLLGELACRIFRMLPATSRIWESGWR